MSEISQTALNRALKFFECPSKSIDQKDILLMLGALMARNTPSVPYHDEQVIAYYGSTNNIHTITYKVNGATIATQTLTYQGGGASDDDLLTGSKIE